MTSSSSSALSVTQTFTSSFPRFYLPELCKGKEIIIGIDEAGRGPVLGSLVYVAAFWPKSENEFICKKYGFDDSKQLKEGDRDKFFENIKSHGSIGWCVVELSAETISKEMLRTTPVSLNYISYEAVIKALETIRDSDNMLNPPIIKDIFIDTVGDPEFYKSRLTNALGNDFANFVIEKKADATYKIVSAASIIAKVTRDTLLKEWEWIEATVKLDKSFGSGYPGDENCVQWLSKAQHPVFGFPNLIRFSWSTSREALLKGIACDVKWECDEDDDGSTPAIQSFFGLVGEKRPKRSAFFTQRKMKHVLSTDLSK